MTERLSGLWYRTAGGCEFESYRYVFKYNYLNRTGPLCSYILLLTRIIFSEASLGSRVKLEVRKVRLEFMFGWLGIVSC